MSLAVGERLGPYEVLAEIGEGGMGVVYKARDTRLDRTVAIKTVKGEFSERFQREAKAIAALNHPHICTLYDIGPDYLVMEYIEGRPPKGPLPFDEALRLARQIAEALEAAHRKGIIHRDLKPGNVLVTKAGAKLLDFGLAKPAAKVRLSDETRTQAVTGRNTIVGTIPYMAPEQLEGKEADTRSDIFAFGCILYELLTGRRAFLGETQASLIAAILSRDPPSVTTLAPLTPPILDRIVSDCLAKDPDDRWQSAHDLRAAFDLITLSTPARAVGPRNLGRWPLALGGFFLLAIAMATLYAVRHSRPSPQEVRFQIPAPPNVGSLVGPLLSPDGKHLAFAIAGDGIWIRSLDTLSVRRLSNSDNGRVITWYPDSRSLIVQLPDQLVRLDVSNGSVLSSANIASVDEQPTTNADGAFLARIADDGPLYLMSMGSHARTPATKLDPTIHSKHCCPQFFPDGRRFLYRAMGRKPEDNELRIGSLDRDPAALPLVSVKKAEFGYITFDKPACLLFNRSGTLWAQRINLSSLQLEGDPVTIASDSEREYSVSQTGAIAYLPAANFANKLYRLSWYNRQGKRIAEIGAARRYMDVRLSPDGRRAVSMIGPNPRKADLWTVDLTTGTASRFTFQEGKPMGAVWSPDGKWIAYGTSSTNELFRKPASGVGDEELLEKLGVLPEDWSRDGRFLLVTAFSHGTPDILILPLEGDRKPFPFVTTDFMEEGARFSPDSRWIAYLSDESGRTEVYVRDFSEGPDPSKGKWQISTDGGHSVFWRADGRELYYVSDRVVSIPVLPSANEFHAGPPKVLFEMPDEGFFYGPNPDGSRFLLNVPTNDKTEVPSITLILNWQAGLK
jgi:serine/threonine protein kinase